MISVLIPLYNGIEYLHESLASVINQTFTDWEVIIGINGHPNDSEVEKTAQKVKIDICPENIVNKIRIIHYTTKGKSATLNAMVRDSVYAHIAILDVDDIWSPTKLEKQSEFWDNYDVVGTQCRYFGDVNHDLILADGDISNLDFLQGNPIINSSVVLKKECAYWNEANHILEDYELWINLRLHYKKFYNIPEILCLHRISKNSAFNNKNSQYVADLIQKYRSLK